MNAANCALAMEKEIRRINSLWQQQNLPVANMRIGISTGEVVAGSLGSTQRLKYTTIGDTINVASRLESFDGDNFHFDPISSPCRILIGEATLRFLNDQFRIEKFGVLTLKGKEQKIAAYRLLGRAD
jgi:class 3 adenylate cyclase